MYKGYMYVFGGFDGTDRLNDMWRVAPTAEQPAWERIDQVRAIGQFPTRKFFARPWRPLASHSLQLAIHSSERQQSMCFSILVFVPERGCPASRVQQSGCGRGRRLHVSL